MKAQLVTYLAGSIQDIKDGGVYWRDKITPKLTELGIIVNDPCKSECNHAFGATIVESREQLKKMKRSGNFEAFDEHMRRIIQDDLKKVTESNFIIVYWSNEYKHGGTIHEIVHAWQNHIPIYMICYDSKTDMNDWVLALVRQNGIIFENFSQAVDHIKETYKAEIKELKATKEQEKPTEEKNDK